MGLGRLHRHVGALARPRPSSGSSGPRSSATSPCSSPTSRGASRSRCSRPTRVAPRACGSAPGSSRSTPGRRANMAQSFATLDELSGGRAIAGLGVSHKPVVEHWFDQSIDKPLAEMREYVAIMRAILRGEDPPPGEKFRTAFHFIGMGAAAAGHADLPGRPLAGDAPARPARSPTAWCCGCATRTTSATWSCRACARAREKAGRDARRLRHRRRRAVRGDRRPGRRPRAPPRGGRPLLRPPLLPRHARAAPASTRTRARPTTSSALLGAIGSAEEASVVRAPLRRERCDLAVRGRRSAAPTSTRRSKR